MRVFFWATLPVIITLLRRPLPVARYNHQKRSPGTLSWQVEMMIMMEKRNAARGLQTVLGRCMGPKGIRVA